MTDSMDSVEDPSLTYLPGEASVASGLEIDDEYRASGVIRFSFTDELGVARILQIHLTAENLRALAKDILLTASDLENYPSERAAEGEDLP